MKKLKEKINDITIKAYVWYKTHQKEVALALFIVLSVYFVVSAMTQNLYAQQSSSGDINSETSGIWENVQKILTGPIGKSLTVLFFIGGIITLIMGQFQAALFALAGAFLFAFGPKLIEAIFSAAK